MDQPYLFNCAVCSKKSQQAVCGGCLRKCREMLNSIPQLHIEASGCLEPATGGPSQGSSERSIGINVLALDFVMGLDLLSILWGWESIIRTARDLPPPALLPLLPNRQAQVLDTCKFHLTHLEFSSSQDWFKDFFDEVTQLHSTGLRAARLDEPKRQRISCPSTNADGLPCGRMLTLETSDLESKIFCSGCRTDWSPARLIAVKTADRSQKWWIDIEAAAGFLALTERHLHRVAKKHKVQRRGVLYDLHQLMDARVK